LSDPQKGNHDDVRRCDVEWVDLVLGSEVLVVVVATRVDDVDTDVVVITNADEPDLRDVVDMRSHGKDERRREEGRREEARWFWADVAG
jgi:hypothetical protein